MRGIQSNEKKMLSHRDKPAFTADVVVVGAGPSGCAAAYDLACAGIRVLLLDRSRFPRRKVCAGGLTVKAFKSLRYSIAPVVHNTIFDLSVSDRMHRQTLLKGAEPVCHMVERSAFDRYCLDRTIAAGARFDIVGRIERVEETKAAVTLFTDAGRVRTRFLIGADGVYSRVRKLTGRFPLHKTCFAVEGIVRGKSHRQTAMGFDFSQVAGGYGWVFPKQDHINFGLYSHTANHALSRRMLKEYGRVRIGMNTPDYVAGYPLGCGGEHYRPGTGRVMLVGDAAGLVEPLLGEGLFHAIRSGQLAAESICTAVDTNTDACRLYARALGPIQADLRFSKIAAMFFYRLPGCGHLLLTSWPARIALMRGFAQGLSLSLIVRHAYRYWMERAVAGRR